MIRMKPVRLIIFDVDGTLVNTIEDITASVNFTLSRLGRPPVPVDRVRGMVGDGIENLMARALGDRTEFLRDAVGMYKVHHSKNLVVRSRLYPGVHETLGHFSGIPLAVISNKTIDFVRPLLEELEIAGMFRVVLGADSGMPLKPEPDMILHVLRTLGTEPARAVMVGDGTTDMLAGKAAGVTTCAATWGFRSEEQLRQLGPDHVIRNIDELKALFEPDRAP